jgi:hypothetical protein
MEKECVKLVINQNCTKLDKGKNRAEVVRGQNVEGNVLASCEVYLIS